MSGMVCIKDDRLPVVRGKTVATDRMQYVESE